MQYAILQYSSMHLAGCLMRLTSCPMRLTSCPMRLTSCPMRLTSCPMRLRKFQENPEAPDAPEAPKDKGAPDNSDAPFNDGKCASRKNCLSHVFFTPPSSPASCGRRSCSAAGPSSEPRRRAPRPRWDKPSSLTSNEPHRAGSRGN